MKIGIIETGRPSAEVAERFGTYAEMVAKALGPEAAFTTLRAAEAELPADPAQFQGYVITGSPASVYDDHAWIEALKGWLRACDPEIPLVGICFGHQIMAEAYGGAVRNPGKGLAVGVHGYEMIDRPDWMGEVPDTLFLPVSHYDQVVTRPPSATVIAASRFCPFAAFTYDDRTALSFQGHPEFSRAVTAEAIKLWRERGKITPSHAREASESLTNFDDAQTANTLIKTFMSLRS